MDRLNYHHLLYFCVAASQGSVTAACEMLHLAQPTVSSRLKKLEKSAGRKLLERSRRGLVLTETSKLVFEYADEIFSLGQELTEITAAQQPDRPLRFAVEVEELTNEALRELFG